MIRQVDLAYEKMAPSLQTQQTACFGSSSSRCRNCSDVDRSNSDLNNEKTRDDSSHRTTVAATKSADDTEDEDVNEFSSGAKDLTNGSYTYLSKRALAFTTSSDLRNDLSVKNSFIKTENATDTLQHNNNKSQFNRTTPCNRFTVPGGRQLLVVILAAVLLHQCSWVAARPNLTAVAAAVQGSTGMPTVESHLADTTSGSHLDKAISAGGGGEEHAVAEGHEVERLPVFQIDFARVELPFIIGVWILFASIAKIGKF